MKKKTVWISAAIAVVVAIPGVSAWATSVSPSSPAPTSIVAETTAPAANSTEAAETMDGKGEGKGKGKGVHFKVRGGDGFLGGGFEKGGINGDVHGQEYLTLLAEKYAPDQTAAIKAAYDERTLISKQIKDLLAANKGKFQNQDLKAKADAINAKVTSGELTQAQADEQLKALKEANRPGENGQRKEIDAINAKVKSGELTQAQADEQIKALKEAKGPHKEVATAAEKVQMDAAIALHDSFDTAVQAVVNGGSADQLTQVLPKLIENLKAENLKLNEKLAKLQTEVAPK